MTTLYNRLDFRIYNAECSSLTSKWNTDNFSRSSRYTPLTRLYFPLKGRGMISFEGRKYPLTPGTLLLIFPSAPVKVSCHGHLELFFVQFNACFHDTETDIFNVRDGVMKIDLNHEEFSFTKQLFETVRQNWNRQDFKRGPVDELAAKSAMGLLTAPFLREIGKSQAGNDSFWLLEMTVWMNKNMNKKLDIREFAKRFNLHPIYLANQFKKHTGLAPLAYQVRIRVQFAMTELRRGELRIKEIADKTGVTTSAFSRMFKRITGFSPREYRSLLAPGKIK